MRKIIVTFFLFICPPCWGQMNLVFNSGFERYSSCPLGMDQSYLAFGWHSLDTPWYVGSIHGNHKCYPDFIHSCCTDPNCSEPANARFYHYPHKGKAMMQVSMYYDYYWGYSGYLQDYLQGHLCHSLDSGQIYCVTFYTVMDQSSGYAVNHIGAYFDDGTIDTTAHCGWVQTQCTPQVVEDSVINDTSSWVKIQGNFVANGHERFITIGVFTDTAHTTHIQRYVSQHFGLFLIDDVSVIASNAQATAGADKWVAAGDSTWIGVDSNGDGMPCYWYVLGATTPI